MAECVQGPRIARIWSEIAKVPPPKKRKASPRDAFQKLCANVFESSAKKF